jgi:hypothetical protein
MLPDVLAKALCATIAANNRSAAKMLNMLLGIWFLMMSPFRCFQTCTREVNRKVRFARVNVIKEG